MPKYVDVDALLQSLPDDLPYKSSVKRVLTQAPAADVEEVVRCRDCRHFTKGMAIGMCKRVEGKPIIPCVADNFCKYGDYRTYDDEDGGDER